MKAKKIIKGIVKLTAVSGVAYLAYKVGEYNGKEQERQKHIEDYCDFEDNIYAEGEPYEPAPSGSRFRPLTVSIDGVTNEMLNQALMLACARNSVSNKTVRERLNVDFDTAAKVLEAFEQAGYVGKENLHYIRKSNLTLSDYPELCFR